MIRISLSWIRCCEFRIGDKDMFYTVIPDFIAQDHRKRGRPSSNKIDIHYCLQIGRQKQEAKEEAILVPDIMGGELEVAVSTCTLGHIFTLGGIVDDGTMILIIWPGQRARYPASLNLQSYSSGLWSSQ